MTESVKSYKEIVENIKSADFCFPVDFPDNNDVSSLSTVAKAREIVSSDRISFIPKLGCFVVAGATGNFFTVQLFPQEKCSCLLPHTECCHIVSVKMALRMRQSPSVTTKSVNLTVLRKKARGSKKPGRKQPRPGDVDYQLPDDCEEKTRDQPPFRSPIRDQPIRDRSPIRESVRESVRYPSQVRESPIRTEPIRDRSPIRESVRESVRYPSQVRESPIRTEDDVRDISVEDVREDDVRDISVDDVRDSVERAGIDFSQESWGRIDGTVDNGWLDDTVIDAAQQVLARQFPTMDGLQSCTYAEKPCFRPVTDYFVQIVNTHPRTGGQHWVTISTYTDPTSPAVKLYDSFPSSRLASSVEDSIASVLHSPHESLYVYFMNADIQINGNDCGLYAIANATEICHGFDPVNVSFDQTRLRSHLRRCLETGVLSRFPSHSVDNRMPHTSIRRIKLFCSCRMPDTGFMFKCTTCRRWFHPKCQNIRQSDKQIKKLKVVKCLECRS